MVIAISVPKNVFNTDLKNFIIFCSTPNLRYLRFGFQLPSLPLAYEQQKAALFCVVT